MKRAVLASVAVVVTALVGTLSHSGSSPARDAEPAPVATPKRACRFNVGQRLGFELASVARARPSGAAETQDLPEDRFHAALAVEVVEASGGAARPVWRMRGALSRMTLVQRLTRPEERVDAPLTEAFEWTIDDRCRWSDLSLPRAWSARGRHLVATIITSFELVLPDTSGAKTWTARQRDGLGRFLASYEADDRALIRRKLSYTSTALAPDLRMDIRVLGGATRGALAADGAWLAQAELREEIQLRVGRAFDVVLQTVQTLSRNDALAAPIPEVAALTTGSVFDEAAEAPAPAKARPDETRWSSVAARLAAWRSMEDDHALAEDLAARIRARPQLSRELLAALRARDLPDGARGPVFLALELSGTHEAWAVLSEAMTDADLPELDQARAASALSDHGRPSVRTADALAEVVQQTESDMVRSVAQLGMGNLARRAAEDPETLARVRGHLRTAVATARTQEDRVLVLDALGNAGDASFLPTIEPYLDDDSLMLRTHAAEALRNLPPATAVPLLQARLQAEPQARARKTVVATLAQFGPPAPDMVPALSARLTQESSPEVRGELVRWLGTQPAAQGVLVAQFKRERHAGVMKLIGRFVPGEALW